ncbi:heavy metal translocating P-type ATPase [Alicyclobacillus mengziensis]|uniref:Cd(2+)-exporting ATPase n=1 Tax=Alicyclobacillus mengziensis TaxID=2931921 RepID=A0A9X7VZM6_9BACL|nr:cation-translocating P-type ATPase [Alicyclobacillus mengziensis]QSO46658.1 cadmium-translocating P-type ATPase [Alicyclobacillus mengziensis]
MKTRLSLAAGAIVGGLVIHYMRISLIAEDFLMWTAVALCGVSIVRQALREVRQRRLGVQTLITIAVIGAILIGQNIEAASVVFLFQLGSQLEGRALKKTRGIVQRLFNLFPETAVVVRNGSEQVVAQGDIVQKDTVLVRPGDKVPVDGTVLRGAADVNESAITGESFPIVKTPGSLVFSGSIVQSGYLQFSADRVGDETIVAQMIQMIEDAESSKTKVQRVLDRFATYYTPAIVLLAVLVYLWTQKPVLALTLLVVACPGALVIATPVSVVTGVGRAAREGILIKGGVSLERVANIDTLAFDKTGTLTTGNLKVTTIRAHHGSESDLIRLAASAERPSEHFVGKAIVQFAKQRLGDDVSMPDAFQEFPGRGIRAEISGNTVYVGNMAFLREMNVRVSDAFTLNPASTVFIAQNGQMIGEIAISDTIREDAQRLIQQVRKLGIKNIVMLTGDNALSAAEIATEAGIDKVYSSLLPSGKVEVIRHLQETGHKVAMVGDGINDAPAMTAADAAITLKGATGLALESADVVLMSNQLSTLYDALRLCRKTRANIRENVLFAVLISLTLVFGTTQGLIVLASGMLIHEVSILIVVVNAMRLFTPTKHRQTPKMGHLTQISG